MPRRFESRYCQSGRNRANAEVPTGSTCARSAARDRLRRIRSTSASHHCSESVASEVNSPRTSWPRAAIAESVSAATRTPRRRPPAALSVACPDHPPRGDEFVQPGGSGPGAALRDLFGGEGAQ
ncbi:Uncharacterised protein [Mycobacteroides abscessus subsp. abscessus]|nr:Uncharacterised protein [Mycobacteroides abscessus subsp. abscessus]